MSLAINKPGILTTVQDLGRRGFRRFGINQNGAMDQTAVRLINALLANDENEAVLEMHFPAPEILFGAPAVFGLGGADFGAKLDGRPLENWRIHAAAAGSVIKFEQKNLGNRAYLAVRGGFALDSWLGSRSTNLKAGAGGFGGRRLRAGDRIEFRQRSIDPKTLTGRRISGALIPFYASFPTVRVVAGAEFGELTAAGRDRFLQNNFIVSRDSDRMGFRLTGEPLARRKSGELVSAAVAFGTIQLLPDGQLIALMADHQTSGGYPRLANVITRDLSLIAQLGAHDTVAFHLVSVAAAESLLLDFERNFNLLKTAAKFL